MLRWLGLSTLVVLFDQYSKWLAERELELYQQLPLMPSVSLMLAYNEGAAFSFLSDAGGWQRYFFIVVGIVVTLVLIVWLQRLQRGEKLLAAALGLIIGGAIGNLIDRVLHGKVTDFILLHYDGWYWPAFNIADSAIAVGAVLLLYDAFFLHRDDKTDNASTG